MTSNSTVPSQPIPSSSSASSSNAIPASALSTAEDVGPDSFATAEEARQATTSPPIDPTRLNNQPAVLPPSSPPTHTNANTNPLSPPLRDTDAPLDSAYLDSGAQLEPSSHPTIAETGVLQSPDENPGPKQGQLRRASKPQSGEEIIKLGSLGGEGLQDKPASGSFSGQ
ncbi:uncharacterized protein IL334_006354 [Kwoniella shivajii]|uniref:Uncharacterized protein n=1 Tax=Kwoniella shivajii TaxID=564305 RepID=A0ABZ1D5Q3_9TREE|nr:hypothetical protein IL334_006354 [Kwoniella shivajii]